MNTETATESTVQGPRDTLLATMMVFMVARRRHAITHLMAATHMGPAWHVAHFDMATAESDAHEAMLEALATWVDAADDGFGELSGPARAFLAAEDCVNAATGEAKQRSAMQTASNAFDALVTAAERVAERVAAVN